MISAPDVRPSITHKFTVGGFKGYLVVELSVIGQPAGLWIKMAKEGSTLAGLMDALAQSVSIGLNAGIPISVYADRFIGTRFEPHGFTRDKDIAEADSILDYIFRWIDLHTGNAARSR